MSERRSELKAVPTTDDAHGAKAGRDMMQMTTRMMDNWTQVNSRLITLVQASFRHNLTAAEELRQCQSPHDVMDCQMKLARQAYDEYIDEARQISEMVAKMSTEAMGYLNIPR